MYPIIGRGSPLELSKINWVPYHYFLRYSIIKTDLEYTLRILTPLVDISARVPSDRKQKAYDVYDCLLSDVQAS